MRFCGATNFFDGPKYGIFALFSASTRLEAKIAKNAFFVKKFVAPHMHQKCVLEYQNLFFASLDGKGKKNKIFYVLDQFSRFCGATNFFDDPKFGIFANCEFLFLPVPRHRFAPE